MWLRPQSHKHKDWMLTVWWPSIQRKKKSTPQLDMSGCWQFLWNSTLKKACKFHRPKAQSIDIYLKCQSTEKCDHSNWNCLSSWIINTAGSTKNYSKKGNSERTQKRMTRYCVLLSVVADQVLGFMVNSRTITLNIQWSKSYPKKVFWTQQWIQWTSVPFPGRGRGAGWQQESEA